MKILLVDDNGAHRAITKRALTKTIAHCEFIEADSLNFAREILRKGIVKFSLAVVDLNLGDGRGTEFITELRNHPEYNELPIISLSTSTLAEDAKESYQAGASCYIPKGDNVEIFTQNLTQAISYFSVFTITSANGADT